MNDTFNLEPVIERTQNKVKRMSKLIWVYFVKGKIVSTTSPDDSLEKKLIGVYDGRKKTYRDSYLDDDIRWATKRMQS